MTRIELIEKAHKIMASDPTVTRGGAALQVTAEMTIEDVLEFLKVETSERFYEKRALRIAESVRKGDTGLNSFRTQVSDRLLISESQVI